MIRPAEGYTWQVLGCAPREVAEEIRREELRRARMEEAAAKVLRAMAERRQKRIRG